MSVQLDELEVTRCTVNMVKQIFPAIQAVWDEVDQRNTSMELNPDYDLYQQLEDQGVWYFYTVKYEETYSFYSFLVQPSLHVKGSKQVVPDVIYVDPKHRGKGIVDVLVQISEEIGKQEGANYVSVTLKEFDKHDSLVERLGYTLYENTYQKVI